MDLETAATPNVFLTTEEVARRLNCSVRAVVSLITTGQLSAIRLGQSPKGRAAYRVSAADLEAFIALHRVPVTPTVPEVA